MFPTSKEILIAEGTSISDASEIFKENNLIRSVLLFKTIFRQKPINTSIKAGVYKFTEPLTAFEIAEDLIDGSYNSPLMHIMFPEGFYTKDFDRYLSNKLDLTSDLSLHSYEGYLFPDTYYISKDTTIESLVSLMQSNLFKKLKPYEELISKSSYTLHEILTLASLIEKEAKDLDSKKMVSGILQNRLKVGMPLQVDATFTYLYGLTSDELTLNDLKIDSPYNTYLYTGLPPAPISNPGMNAILAVLEPAETDFMYYLTGNDGKFYYAKSFADHKLNKEKYLR